MPLSSAPGIAPGQTPTADSALSQLSQDYTRFMKLLVAQVSHQDPLKPMDGTEFISQVAQLTQVEQSVQANKQIEALRAQLSLSAALGETALIGREVTIASESFVLGESGGRFSYELERQSSGVSAIITDAQGRMVRQIDNLPGAPGTLVDVAWDGLDNAGNPVAPGTYGIALSVTGAGGGEPGGYNTYTDANVAAIEFSQDAPMLRLGDGRLVSSRDIVRAG